MKTRYFNIIQIGSIVQMNVTDWNRVKRWIETHGGKVEEKYNNKANPQKHRLVTHAGKAER